jgi:hypothetical protein
MSIFRNFWVAIFSLIVVVSWFAFYVVGAVSYHRGFWPIPQLKAMKQSTTPFVPANHAVTDQLDRLVGYGGKHEIPCPAQSSRTPVLLIAGQSNAANSGGQRYVGAPGVVNYFGGKCYEAASPLLGSTGIAGDSWTPLGNKLIESGVADHVILIASAMSGTSIERWKEGGDLNPMLMSVIAGAQRHYKITHVLWHQGEWDVGNMSAAQYKGKFMSLVHSIRSSGVDAPIFVSIATRCELTDIPWKSDNEIAKAQRALPDPAQGIFQGVNTDELIGSIDRVDDCHFAHTGQEKMSSAWPKLLAGAQP